MTDNPRLAVIDDVMPGKHLGEKTIEVTRQGVRDHIASLGLPDRDGDVAPFLFLGTEPWGWPGSYVAYWLGGVAQDMRWHSLAPVRVGTVLRAEARVSDRYVQRSRECSVVTVDLFDETGALCQSGSGTYSAKVDPAAVRADVPRRDQASSRGAAAEVIQAGTPRALRLDGDMSRLFWRHRDDLGDGNFHTKVEAAHALGMPDILIGSSQLASLAGEQAHALLGDAWLHGGELTTRFLKPVFAGDEITISLDRVSGPEGAITLDGRMTNQRAEMVLAITGRLAGN